ncbi:MAG: hypothetical protein ABS920_11105 [Sporosarcina sp.]
MTSSKKIENPKRPHSQKAGVNDHDLLSAAIATEKNLDIAYVTAMHEVGQKMFYSLYFDLLKETSLLHQKLLELQFRHGWSSLIPTATEEVEALQQEYAEYRQELK